MGDDTTRIATPNRRCWLTIGGGVAVIAVVAVGLLVGRGNSPGAQDLAVDRSSAPATTTPVGDAAAATARGPQGKGQPIDISGSSPIDGSRVNLTSVRGKPVVLQIWASWCPGCNQEAPHVAELAKTRTDVAFVGLNFRDTGSEARAFYRKYGWTLPSIEDATGDTAFGLGLQGTPTTIFLDAQHREVGRFVGAVDPASFTKAVDVLTGAA